MKGLSRREKASAFVACLVAMAGCGGRSAVLAEQAGAPDDGPRGDGTATGGGEAGSRDGASTDGTPGSIGCDAGIASAACVAQVVPTSFASVLAVDDKNVYWGSQGQTGASSFIMAAPRKGGAVVTLAQASPASMAADGTALYWTDQIQNGVFRIPAQGGEVVTLTPTSEGGCLALDDTNVYWVSATSVNRVAKAGGEVTTLVSNGQNLTGVVAQPPAVYWTQDQGIVQSIDGGHPEALLADAGGRWPSYGYSIGTGCRVLAAGGGAVYFGLESTASQYTLGAVSVSGGSPWTVLSLATFPRAVVANSTAVYTVDTTATAVAIEQTPLDGGATTTLVTPDAPWVTDIVLASDGTLYWTTDVQVQSMKPGG